MKRYSLAAAWLMALLLAACDAIEPKATLQIGVILPLTGTLSDAGNGVLRGAEFALEEVNDSGMLGDTDLTFAVQDNGSTTAQTLEAANMLVSASDIPVIFGPVSSSATRVIIPTLDSTDIVGLGPTSSATGLGTQTQWLFRTSLTVERMVPAGMTVAKRQLNYTKAATIYNSADTFSTSCFQAVTAALHADAGVAIVSAQSYHRPPGMQMGDLTTALSDVISADPDVIFVSGLSEDLYGVVTQLYDLGQRSAPYVSVLLSLVDAQRINVARPGAMEGSITFTIWHETGEGERNEAFVANYTAQHGTAPSDLEARGYAGIYILAEALAHAEAYEAPAIRNALGAIKGLETIYGPFAFDSNGDAIYDPVVARVEGNAFVVLN